jgi:short-subunit dehydrogenase
MAGKLQNAVVVITGASSGIGRATARRFARAGATLVLAARREHYLDAAARECRDLGAEVATVALDVSDEPAVKGLAVLTVERYGRIDTWVNNAAVTAFATVDRLPLEDFRRIIDVNLFGYVHGARAVLPIFRRQGHGVLVNVGSVVSRVSQPYVGAYTVSKHGVRALGMVLRQELLIDGVRGVHVCTVMPGTIDTPLFHHAANYTGRRAKAMPPVYPPDQVARAIVRCVSRPRREVLVGAGPRMMAQQMKLLPGMTERRLARLTDKQQLYRDRAESPTPGNLYQPVADPGSDTGSEVGGWHGRRKTMVRRGLGAGVGAAAALVLQRGLSRG